MEVVGSPLKNNEISPSSRSPSDRFSHRLSLGLNLSVADEEEFIGEGEANLVDTSATKTAGGLISRFFNDKDWLDTLFSIFKEDEDGGGSVRVSKLLEVMRFTMSGDFESLGLQLDPLGCDMPVDLETFRHGFLAWDGKQVISEHLGLFSESIANAIAMSQVESDMLNKETVDDVDDLPSNPVTNNPVVDSNDEMMDSNTLEAENSQLKFKNCNLVDENRRLEHQMMNLEEVNAQLHLEVDQSKNRIHSLQRHHLVLEEEVHSVVTKHQESSARWSKERAMILGERNDLERQQKQLKDELTETLTELTNLRSHEELLKSLSVEKECQFIETVNERLLLDEQLKQKSDECAKHKEVMLDTLRNNKYLSNKKRELEEEVIRLREHLCLLGGCIARQKMNDNDLNGEITLSYSMMTWQRSISGEEVEENLDLTMENVLTGCAPSYQCENQENSLFSELMDMHPADSPIDPICGKRPSSDYREIENLAFSYGWDMINGLTLVLEQITEHLESVTANDLIEKYPLPTDVTDSVQKMTKKTLENTDSSTTTMVCEKSKRLTSSTGRVEFDDICGGGDSEASPLSLSPETLRDQINDQLKMLRLQIAKSQTILTSLQAKSMSQVTDSKKATSPTQSFPRTDLTFSQSSLQQHSRILNRCCTPGTSESTTSTPMHHRFRTRSCPILPSETSFVTKGTQTEPVDLNVHTLPSSSTNSRSRQTNNHGRRIHHNSSATPTISVITTTSTDSAGRLFADDDLDLTPMTRNRSQSYSKAIELGNRADETDVGTGTFVADDGSGDDIRLTLPHPRHLSVLREEDHEDSDHGQSPMIRKARPVQQQTQVPVPQPYRPPPPIIRLPPPYRPPPPPPTRQYRSTENVTLSRPAYMLGNASKSVETLQYQPCHRPNLPVMAAVPATSQRLRPDVPIRQFSDPFPANADQPGNPGFPPPSLMAATYQSMSAQSLDGAGTDPWLCTQMSIDGKCTLYRPPVHYTPTPPLVGGGVVISPERETVGFVPAVPPMEDRMIRPSDILDSSSPKRQHRLAYENPSLYQTRQSPLAMLVSSTPSSMLPVVDVLSDKMSAEEAEEFSDASEESIKKMATGRFGSRRRRRSLGGTNSNNSPAFQRSKAVDFEECDVEIVEPTKDESDTDVKRDILEGMSQMTHANGNGNAQDTHRESKLIPKSRLLMPELTENSETESAKNSGGSMESETEQPVALLTQEGAATVKTPGGGQAASCDVVLTPPQPCGDGPFPSLPDSFLRALQLHKESDRIDRLTEKDVESKFHSLILAFKTDRFTLSNRLELHQRQRDIAEKNIEEEIVNLKDNLNALSQICGDEETRELVKRLHHHLEVLHQSTARMSSRAEVYGAVQQEERMNKAIEVMLVYVENLKRIQDKSAQDLEEIRRVMTENNLLSEDGSETEETRRNLRTYSVTGMSSVGKPGSRRRASIAALPRSWAERADGKTKFINFVNSAAARHSVCSIGSRRCSLYYNLRPFPNNEQSPNDKSVVLKRQAVDDLLIPSSSSVEHSDDEYSRRPKRLPNSCRTSARDSIGQEDASQSTTLESPKTPDSVFINDRNENGGNDIDIGLSNGVSIHQSEWCGSIRHASSVNYPTDQSDDDEETDHQIVQPSTSLSHRMSTTSHHNYHGPSSANGLLSLTQWIQDDHLFHGVRYTIGGLLLVAALVSLLFAFLPGKTTAMTSCYYPHTWRSIKELVEPQLGLYHRARPPI